MILKNVKTSGKRTSDFFSDVLFFVASKSLLIDSA